MKKKVISRDNLPTRLPVWETIACTMAIVHYDLAAWAIGASIMLLVLLWIACIVSMIDEKPKNIFKD